MFRIRHSFNHLFVEKILNGQIKLNLQCQQYNYCISLNNTIQENQFIEHAKFIGKWGFRRLILASRKAFKGDDIAIQSARKEVISHYHQNKENYKKKDINRLKEMIQEIDDIVSLLEENIIQGKRNDENGRYQVKINDNQKIKMKKDNEIIHVDDKTVLKDNKKPGNCSCHSDNC